MIPKKIDNAILKEGYRFCRVKPENTGVYYKYVQEGFHVVIVIELSNGATLTVEQQRTMEERVKGLFFRPQGNIADFPEGFPVYHVEVLTLLVGQDSEIMRMLCAQCENTWAYLSELGQLLIYENQPGDFWGLKGCLENMQMQKYGKHEANFIPYITIGLTAVNVLVFLILELLGNTEDGLFIAAHGGMYPNFILYSNQWWRIITAGFVHFGLEHLLNNMVIFCCVGTRLEKTIGHWRMICIYMLSEIGGSLLSYAMMLHTGDYAVSAGASGAVFGIIGGLLWAVILNRGHLEGLTTRGIIIMIVLSLYFGFTATGVDNWAHVGGMLTGFVSTVIFYHRKYQKC